MRCTWKEAQMALGSSSSLASNSAGSEVSMSVAGIDTSEHVPVILNDDTPWFTQAWCESSRTPCGKQNEAITVIIFRSSHLFTIHLRRSQSHAFVSASCSFYPNYDFPLSPPFVFCLDQEHIYYPWVFSPLVKQKSYYRLVENNKMITLEIESQCHSTDSITLISVSER